MNHILDVRRVLEVLVMREANIEKIGDKLFPVYNLDESTEYNFNRFHSFNCSRPGSKEVSILEMPNCLDGLWPCALKGHGPLN